MRIVSDLIQGYFHKLKNQSKSPLQLAAQEIWWEGTFDTVKKRWVIWKQNQQINNLL